MKTQNRRLLKLSEYQNRHLKAQIEALKYYESLEESDRLYLKWLTLPYMHFRDQLDIFTNRFFKNFCEETCFRTGRSACCGFESIITFFADEIINLLWGGIDAGMVLIERLKIPNRPPFCVYLGSNGCIWAVRPLSCAMFFCDDAKKYVFKKWKEAEEMWMRFREQEKLFVWPTHPVLFDLIEASALYRVNSPHMYFHSSPGLLKIKREKRE